MTSVKVFAERAIRQRTCLGCTHTIGAGETHLRAVGFRDGANYCKDCALEIFAKIFDLPLEELWSKINK
jgi:hypothetical protein